MAPRKERDDYTVSNVAFPWKRDQGVVMQASEQYIRILNRSEYLLTEMCFLIAEGEYEEANVLLMDSLRIALEWNFGGALGKQIADAARENYRAGRRLEDPGV